MLLDFFYNNAIESLHSVIKKEVTEKKTPSDLIRIIKDTIIMRQEQKEVRAIYGSGKYRLSDEYKHFEV